MTDWYPIQLSTINNFRFYWITKKPKNILTIYRPPSDEFIAWYCTLIATEQQQQQYQHQQLESKLFAFSLLWFLRCYWIIVLWNRRYLSILVHMQSKSESKAKRRNNNIKSHEIHWTAVPHIVQKEKNNGRNTLVWIEHIEYKNSQAAQKTLQQQRIWTLAKSSKSGNENANKRRKF